MSKKYWYDLCWQFHYKNVELENALKAAAESAYKADVIDTNMLYTLIEGQNITIEEYKEDFISDMIEIWIEEGNEVV